MAIFNSKLLVYQRVLVPQGVSVGGMCNKWRRLTALLQPLPTMAWWHGACHTREAGGQELRSLGFHQQTWRLRPRNRDFSATKLEISLKEKWRFKQQTWIRMEVLPHKAEFHQELIGCGAPVCYYWILLA